jgi:uncharacterized delta-60 repeat protein
MGSWLAVASGLAQSVDSFNPRPNAPVYAIVTQSDGNILIGGAFTNVAGQQRNCIARLNAEGVVDTTFNPNANGTIYALAEQADGKILTAGDFTSLAGQTCNYIGRLYPDGTLDTSFNPAASGTIYSLAMQADGKLLVGGLFNGVGGQPRDNLARLNPDGSLDVNFNPGASGFVYSLAVQADGGILVGGSFPKLAGQTRWGLGRLNPGGSLDTAFNPNSGAGSYFLSLAVQGDNKILAGGGFGYLGGQIRTNIGRLNSDGSLDTTFDPGVGRISYSFVYSLALQADGRILVGGSFSSLAGQSCNNIGRLNADGTLDSTFNTGASNAVYSLAVQIDGKTLVGGSFTSLGGQDRNSLGRLNNADTPFMSLSFSNSVISWLRDGSSPEVWRTTFDGSPNAADWTTLGAGVRVSGGWQFSGVSLGTNATIRARGYSVAGYVNASGSLIEQIIGPPVVTSQPASRTNTPRTAASFSATAIGAPPMGYRWLKNGIPLNDSGDVYGTRTSILSLPNVFGSDAANYSLWVTNNVGSVTSRVTALTVLDPFITTQPADREINRGQAVAFMISVAGSLPIVYQWFKDGGALPGATGAVLTIANSAGTDAGNYWAIASNEYGSVTSSVAALTLNVVDTRFNPGANSLVATLAVQADGRILVGGGFWSLSGQSCLYFGRLNTDGTLDSTFNPRADGQVNSLTVQADGKILVAGDFSSLAGQSRNHIGRFNNDGTLDTKFDPGTDNRVNALAMQADGKVLVGGEFTSLAGQTRNCIGRLNADGSLDSAFNPSANGGIYALALQPDGKILVGGYFTSLVGQDRYCLGRLNADGTLDESFQPGDNAGSYVYSLAIQPDGKILLGGEFQTLDGQPSSYFGRLNADGSLDSLFQPGTGPVYCLAMQTDARILAGGVFNDNQARNFLVRFNSDGTLDASLNPREDGPAHSLSLLADGRILVGGYFTSLGGLPRANIGLLNNTDSATQELVLSANTISWRRGGTSPEVWRTTFEFCTNSADWVGLGAGGRVPGGWQLSGFSIPANANIRARGYPVGAGGIIETTLLPIPVKILFGDSSFGFISNRFGFNFVGPAGTTAVVESSTDLKSWLPRQTNLLSVAPQYFSEPGASSDLQGFYRLRIQ